VATDQQEVEIGMASHDVLVLIYMYNELKMSLMSTLSLEARSRHARALSSNAPDRRSCGSENRHGAGHLREVAIGFAVGADAAVDVGNVDAKTLSWLWWCGRSLTAIVICWAVEGCGEAYEGEDGDE